MQLVANASAHDETWAWGLIRALARRASLGAPLVAHTGVVWAGERLEEVEGGLAQLLLEPEAEPCFQSSLRLAASVRQMFELYLPLCVGRAASEMVLGHVGQSLDGQIATASGASRYVTGPENIVHLHRLRSLVDAVVVGASTVEADDPELTTRLVPGDHPTRVVIDPRLRLPHASKVFADGRAPTLVVCERGRAALGVPPHTALLEVSALEDGCLSLPQVLAGLAARGLRRVFVEGGGVTISHFIRAGRLDRLHVTICPILIGQGRPGFRLPGVERLDGALRPAARHFTMGQDVLFDCRFARQ